jgi:hypothetical protein
LCLLGFLLVYEWLLPHLPQLFPQPTHLLGKAHDNLPQRINFLAILLRHEVNQPPQLALGAVALAHGTTAEQAM